MTVRDMFRAAIQGLSRHRFRASLNVVGVLVGVASIVLLVGVARAVSHASKTAAAGLGTNLVVVYPSGVSASGVQAGIGSGSSITSDDVRALGDPGYVPNAVAAVPTAGLRDNLTSLRRTWQTDVLGSSEDFAQVRGYSLSYGRFFNGAETGSAASVVVLGKTVVDNLVGGNPIGQFVRINNHPFKVIGVFAARGFSGSFDQDDLAVMPLNSLWADVLPSSAPRIDQVLVQASNPGATDLVKAQVTNTLLQRHRILNPALADFQVRTQRDLVASAERTGTLMQWMLGLIAAIALLTGGIGIASLLLGSVSERTYEIGIRRAVGASRGDIIAQFMLESLLLAVVGGVVGIALGVGVASFFAQIVTDLPAPMISATAVSVAAPFAVVVGVVAGIHAALRAARLQPVDAVRRL